MMVFVVVSKWVHKNLPVTGVKYIEALAPLFSLEEGQHATAAVVYTTTTYTHPSCGYIGIQFIGNDPSAGSPTELYINRARHVIMFCSSAALGQWHFLL
ncbi:MAG: hypothetical protein JSR97_13180 [Verrucomicrobia bacterium]|nr:hypothetical protein [Verrucomicrobiota bacterium]